MTPDIRRGEVWDIALPPPAHGRSRAPAFDRPAVVVQAGEHLPYSDTVIVAICYSGAAFDTRPCTVRLEPGKTGLAKRTWVVASQLVTLDREQFIRHRGTVPDEIMVAVDYALQEALGLLA